MGKIDFIVEDEGNAIYISYDENMTIENFMKDYLKNHTNYVTLDPKVYLFKTNGKVLNVPRFLNKTLADLIRPNGRIILSRKQNITYSKHNN